MASVAPMSSFYLIQRLERPVEPLLDGSLPASIRESYLSGGERTEAERLLMSKFFRWDYMGSSEYEFGAVFRAITKAVKDSRQTPFIRDAFTISGTATAYWGSDRAAAPTKEVSAPVYFIGKAEHASEVRKLISESCVSENRERELCRLKERANFYIGIIGEIREETKRSGARYTPRRWKYKQDGTSGWFDLENGWFATTDRFVADAFACLVFVR